MCPASADCLTEARIPFTVEVWNRGPVSPTLSMLVLDFGVVTHARRKSWS